MFGSDAICTPEFHMAPSQFKSGTIPFMSSAPSTSFSPPTQARRWIGIGAAAFLIVQTLLPLRYYLNLPTTDERFAWRMFSTTVRKDCVATLYQTVEYDGRLVEEQIPPIMLTPWQTLLNRQRPSAVEKIMRACCIAPGVVSVRYRLTCGDPRDGNFISEDQWVMDRRDLRMRKIDSSGR